MQMEKRAATQQKTRDTCAWKKALMEEQAQGGVGQKHERAESSGLGENADLSGHTPNKQRMV